jgi:hypothetical protein
MDFVSLEVFPDATGPSQQIKNVATRLQMEQPLGFVARDFPAINDSLPQLCYPVREFAVNYWCAHG